MADRKISGWPTLTANRFRTNNLTNLRLPREAAKAVVKISFLTLWPPLENEALKFYILASPASRIKRLSFTFFSFAIRGMKHLFAMLSSLSRAIDNERYFTVQVEYSSHC